MTKASTPHALPELFLHGLNAGDVEAVVGLYEPDGAVSPDPSKTVRGREAIRAMVTGFLAQELKFVLQDSEVVEVGDVALIRAQWTVRTTDADGNSQDMKIAPTLVARRQAEGHWLVVIDRPVSAD